jgi:hypothetical protein
MTQEEFKFHRAPAVRRRLSEIKPESDIRVRILAEVTEKTDSGIIVSDGDGRAEIMTEPEVMASVNAGDAICAFCRVLPLESGFELRAELIQDMSKLDKETYRKVYW